MSDKLITHFRRFAKIEQEDEAKILSYFEPKTFAKKENLIEENTRCKFHFFVMNGCLRMFFINDKGVEQTMQFAIENWWMTDYMAYALQTQTEFTIQAVEKTDVLVIDFANQEKLLKEFPPIEHYFRLLYQRAYAALQHRTKYLYNFSREGLYHHFNNSFPDFTQRIPQHILASYLNMTPEYLSEIKSKKRS